MVHIPVRIAAWRMLTKTTPLGPNVTRLICERAAQIQVEAAKGRYGKSGVGEVAASLLDEAVGIPTSLREAFDWVAAALEACRRAPGSEQWPTDEEMAGEILQRIEEKRKLVR